MLRAREATKEEVENTGLLHRVYVPEGAEGERFPVVLMVHGRAGNSRVMWIFSKALEGRKPVVVAPQAPIVDPIGGFSWWEMSHDPDSESPAPKATSMEDLSRPLEQLSRFIEALPDVYPVDLNSLYGFGFSQGGAMISTLALRRPELFSGFALLSSFVPGVILKEQQGRFFDALPDVFISHGTEDKVIPIEKAEQSRDALAGMGAEVHFHSDKVAHKVSTSGIRELRTWAEGRIPAR